MRWEDNIEDKPRDINIGLQWCADPSFNSRPVVPENYIEPPRRVIHYKTKNREESDSSDTIPDDEEEVKEEFEAESISSENDHELEVKDTDYIAGVDEEELSEVASVTERMLNKDNAIRAYANLEAAPEAASVTRNKDLFYPTKEDLTMFRTTHHKRYHKLTLMHYMKLMMQDEDIPFLTYPAMMIDVVTGNFGLLGISGADFRLVTNTARSEFQRTNRDSVRSYGSSAKHFDSEPIDDLQDMARCYGNMSDYYQSRGSPVAQRHFLAVQRFALSLTTDECNAPDVVSGAVKWIDGVNQKFMASLGVDVEFGTKTHATLTSSLKKTNPEFLRRLQTIINQRKATQSTSNKRKNEPSSETKNKKKTNAPKTTKKVSDRGVVDLLPKQDGKAVCLRYLSEAGCWSKIEGKCVADDRCHYVPDTPLPSTIIKHMAAKGWGGISPKFPHLQP